VTAEIRNDVIVATEHIKAPPEVVFHYFTDPALIITWIGDRAELDPQPGGVFSLDMGENTARGAYLPSTRRTASCSAGASPAATRYRPAGRPWRSC
jgi:uncharacterized protein YndB with AHSA1/START domain